MAKQSSEEGLSQTVGAAIARQRKSAGFTQSHVADMIGLEKETISRLENGVIAPTIHRLGQFAELFQCPISAFFGEYRGASGDDAAALSNLIGDLPREDRQAIFRVVSEFATIARERDQLRQSIAERRELEKLLRVTEPRPRKRL